MAQTAVLTADAPHKRVNKMMSVCIYILVVEACERLCYYTMFGSMTIFLEDAGCQFSSLSPDKPSCRGASAASGLRASFRMLAYVMPVFGGYVADNILGRYKTILYFTTVYVIGVAMMAVGALPSLMDEQIGFILYILGAFCFMALGTGAIKPNVVAFGADQYDLTNPDEVIQQTAFFSYFYLVINIGSVFSAIWTVSLATADVQAGVTAGAGFVESYTIAAFCMAIALLIFFIATPRYSAKSKGGVTKTPMVSVIRKHLTSAGLPGKVSIFGFLLIPVYLVVTLTGSLIGKQPTFLQFGTAEGITLCSAIAAVLCIISTTLLVVVHSNNNWVKPLASLPAEIATSGPISTAEVITALRVVPTILCINIGFNVGYNGMDIYGAAACQMNVQAPPLKWLQNILLIQKAGQLNGNFYSLGNNISIIIAIPLLEMCIWPALRRMRGGAPISRKAKYIAGFLIVILANVVGMIIEIIRRQRPYIECPLDKFNTTQCGPYDGQGNYLLSQCSPGGILPMSDMSGWWTFIPYFITGCGEVLVNPVLQEFTFNEVAPRLRSFMMGFTLVAMGCIPSVISAIFSGFIPSDMNSGPVIWCYVANSVVSVVLLCAWFFIALPDKTPDALLARADA